MGSSFNLVWSLTSSSGTSLFSSDYWDQGTLVLSQAGQYRLLVGGDGDLTGPYGFELVAVAEPVIEPIAIGDVVTGEITLRGEEDIYTFDAAAGQRVFFQTQLGDSLHLDWSLTSPDRTSLFDSSFWHQER